MDDKKSPDRNDPSEGMNFQKEKMQMVFIWFCHLLGQLKREGCAWGKVYEKWNSMVLCRVMQGWNNGVCLDKNMGLDYCRR
jgi:hypothetical protein